MKENLITFKKDYLVMGENNISMILQKDILINFE